MNTKANYLKPFQEATVEHAFRRLYLDDDATTHFLVADEVGLGKTMVAQGVIREAVAHLKAIGTESIDIVYLCSNQAIARQNLRKLRKALPDDASVEPRRADRMTLMALELGDKSSAGKVNFFPLTPDTSFKMGNAMGKREERRFLYYFLRNCFHGNYSFMREHAQGLPGKSLMRMLKGGVRGRDTDWYSDIADDEDDAETAVGRLGDPKEIIGDLHGRFAAVAALYPTPWKSIADPELDREVRQLVKELRLRIAISSVRLLEPDLIIMDEFQRFTKLLGSDRGNVVAQLVHKLTSFRDEKTGENVRMLLLSATPYRYLTLATDGDDGDAAYVVYGEDTEPAKQEPEGHKEDFEGTLRILFSHRPEIVDEVMAELTRLRAALLGMPDTFVDGVSARIAVQEKLSSGIARTERVDSLLERDSMIQEIPVTVNLETEDIRDAELLQQLAVAAGSRNPIEFWKSAPYLLNFMNGYALLDEIEQCRDENELAGKQHGDRVGDRAKIVRRLLRTIAKRSIQPAHLVRYAPIPARNGRMRALLRYAFDGVDNSDKGDITCDIGESRKASGESALAGRLWMPPALPYHSRINKKSSEEDTADFYFPKPEEVSKALVFSSWQVVPDTVAAIVSYEAERRTSLRKQPYKSYAKASGIEDSATQILKYPSPTLARLIDPLAMCYGDNRLHTLEEQRRHIVATLRQEYPTKRRSKNNQKGQVEQIWDAILSDDNLSHASESRPDLISARSNKARLSNDRGLKLLTDFCLGSPATCALRSLMRVTGRDGGDLVAAASKIAADIVRLMTRPINAAHILDERTDKSTPSWMAALRFATKHDLQSVLDEWFHILANDATDDDGVNVWKIAEAVQQALSVTPSTVTVRNVANWSRKRIDGESVSAKNFTMRGYFAMRLANAQGEKDDDGNRVGHVKDAFCSPFAPFILTTTSIGQEGLDFHPYCHRVYHWNIPTNPVDLEQREGRVQRYKGHALRLNLAEAHADALAPAIRSEQMIDPWEVMFEAAEATIIGGSVSEGRRDGRAPSWVLSGRHRVKRLALIPPFSREAAGYQKVRDDLTLYRLAFGQVRQDDLLRHLSNLKSEGQMDPDRSDELQISLRPK
ncbi:hypothetical protein [Parasphingorhabdus sp.]|uniref:hypothetical protein n=1 Tax=Parasphingorhabdus sp. TaxID=2709688 RepID=UPI00300358C2